MSAPKQNQNAQVGEEPATSFLHVRITPRQKAGFVRAARKVGMKLAAWILETCEQRARKA